MTYPWLHQELSQKPGAVRDFKAEWNWVRYQVGGKLFAAVCCDDAGAEILLTVKLEPLEGEFLRKQYEDIIPGYYMNKTHWNSVKLDGVVPDDVVRDMVEKSYQLILKGLPKKAQAAILEHFSQQ